MDKGTDRRTNRGTIEKKEAMDRANKGMDGQMKVYSNEGCKEIAGGFESTGDQSVAQVGSRFKFVKSNKRIN